MKRTRITVKQMACVGLMTAIVCILAPFSLNIPISPVPISLGTMAVYFVVFVLGMKWGTVCVLLYILLGLAGLPVFTGFMGGIGKLAGPTGGYIVGYVFLALIFGAFSQHWRNRGARGILISALGAALGTFALYFFGTIWLSYQARMSFQAALWAAVIPYIPGDIVKLILAMYIGAQVCKRLTKAGLI